MMRLFAALLTSLALVASTPVAAGAHPPSHTPPVTVASSTDAATEVAQHDNSETIVFTRTDLRRGVRISPDTSVIRCVLKTDDVHDSRHVSGTINVSATASCDSNPFSISLTVRLHFGSTPVGSPGSKTSYGQKYTTTNSSWGGCETGNFSGWSGAYFVAPPGYSPPTQTVYNDGPIAYITCGCDATRSVATHAARTPATPIPVVRHGRRSDDRVSPHC